MSILTAENRNIIQSLIPDWDGDEESLGKSFVSFRKAHPETAFLRDIEVMKQFAASENARLAARHLARLKAGTTALPPAKLVGPEPVDQFVPTTFDYHFPRETEGPLSTALFDALPFSHPMVFVIVDGTRRYKAIALPLEPLTMRNTGFVIELAIEKAPGEWVMDFRTDNGDQKVRPAVVEALTNPGPAVLTGEVATYLVRQLKGAAPFGTLIGKGQTVGGKYQSKGVIRVEGNRIATHITTPGRQLPPLFVSIPSYPSFGPKLLSRAWFESFPDDDPRVYFGTQKDGSFKRYLKVTGNHEELATPASTLITYDDDGCLCIFSGISELMEDAPCKTNRDGKKIWPRKFTTELEDCIKDLASRIISSKPHIYMESDQLGVVQATLQSAVQGRTIINKVTMTGKVAMIASSSTLGGTFTYKIPVPEKPFDLNPVTNPTKFGTREWFVQYTANPFNQNVFTNGEWQFVVLENKKDGDLLVITMMPDGKLYVGTLINSSPDPAVNRPETIALIKQALTARGQELGQVPTKRLVTVGGKRRAIALFDAAATTHDLGMAPLEDGFSQSDALGNKLTLHLQDAGVMIKSVNPKGEPLSHVKFELPGYTAASPQPGSKKTEPVTTLPLNEGPITFSLLNNIPDSHPMAFKISSTDGTIYRAVLTVPREGMDMRFGFFIEDKKGAWSFRLLSLYEGTANYAALYAIFLSSGQKTLEEDLARIILNAYATPIGHMLRPQGDHERDNELGISTHFVIKGSEVIITTGGVDRPQKITRFVIPAYNAFDPAAHPISVPVPDEPSPEPVAALPAPTREEPPLDTSPLQQALERLQSTRPSVAKTKLDELQNKSPLNQEIVATSTPLPIAILIKPSHKKTKDVFGFLHQGGEEPKGIVEIKWGADSDEIAYEVTGQKGKMHLDSNGMRSLRPTGPHHDAPHGTAHLFYEDKKIYLSVTEGTKLCEWLDLGLFGPRLGIAWQKSTLTISGIAGDEQATTLKSRILAILSDLAPKITEDQDHSWQAKVKLEPNSAADVQKMSGILDHVAKIYAASIGQARTVQYKKPPADFHWEEWEEKIEVPMRTAVGLSPQAITLKGKVKIHNESGEVLEKTLVAIEYGSTKNLRKSLKTLPGIIEVVQVVDEQTTERFDLEITLPPTPSPHSIPSPLRGEGQGEGESGKIVTNISNYAILWAQIIPVTDRQSHNLPESVIKLKGETCVDREGTISVTLAALTYGDKSIPLPATIDFPLAIPIKSKTNADNPGWEDFLLNVQVENGRVVANVAEYIFTSERDVTTTVTLKPRFADAEDHLDPLELELSIQNHPEMGRILTTAKIHHPPPNPLPSREGEVKIVSLLSREGEVIVSLPLDGGGPGRGWQLQEGSNLTFSLPNIGSITYTLTNTDGDPGHIKAMRDLIELVWETNITGDSVNLVGVSSSDQEYTIPLEVKEHAGEKRYFVPAEKISFLTELHLLAGQPWHYDPQKYNTLEVITINGRFMEFAPLTIEDGALPVRAIPFTDIRVLRDLTNPARVVGAHSDIDVALGTREATARGAEFLQFQEGEVFTPTATTIKMLMDHIVTTDHGTAFNFVNNAHYEYELEAAATGVILVLPVRWSTDRASRLAGDDQSEGDPTNRPSNPFVLRMGEPILFYRIGETRASAQPLQAAGLRVHDQGGAWTIYHLGSRYADQQVGPRGEKGFTDWRLSALVSPVNPTLIGLFNLIGPDGSMDEAANYRRDAKEQIEAEIIRHLTRSPDELPVLEYYRSRIRAVKGKPHELIFYASEDENQWARITGISVIVDGGYLRLNDDLTLSFGTGEVTDENVTEKFSIAAMNPADPADKTQIIMRVVDETRVPLFRMDLRSGKLVAIPADQDVPVLPAVDFAETLKGRNFPVLDEERRQTYQRKTQAPDPKGVVRVDENINPLPRGLVGFDYPAVIHTATDPAHSAQLVASLAGHIFLPVEKTLFDQLLIGRTQETMIFMATNGALLEIPMLLAEDGSRYMADREANPVWSLQGTRLLIPDPQKPGEYFDLAAPFHSKAGPQSTTLELNVGEGQSPLNLKQILTAQTLNGTSGRRAFGFYPVFANTEHDLQSGKLMRRLNELVEYHYLDDPKQALQIASMDATSGTIRLQNGVELDAHIAPMFDDSYELLGVEFEPDSKIYTGDLQRAYDLFIPEDGGALYFLTDPSGAPIVADAEDAGHVLRFIIQRNGIPLFFKRRPGIKHFIDAPETREFEMVGNEGEHYPGGATSAARLIALHDAGAKQKFFEARAALGRWEGATGSGLKYLGREAQVRFQVECLESGGITVSPKGFIKEEATGGAREKEKTFKPADVEMIPRFNGMVRVVLREQGNPGNYAMLEFASPAHLTDPQKFAVNLAHYNRRNARLNKMPSEEGFLDAVLRFEPLDIGLMHFLDAVIPADEKNSLGKITGCYADYALLQGVLETIGFHEGHAHWPLAMRSLLEVARGGELPAWDGRTDLEALRTKYNLPPEKKPEQSLMTFLQEYELWADLPEPVQNQVADGQMTTLEDLVAFYDSLDAGDEKKLIREQTASLHLVLSAQKMAHAENVLAIAENRDLYPPSDIIIKTIMERMSDCVDEPLSLEADIEELHDRLRWDRSLLATLYLVFITDEALGLDLITQLKKIMAFQPARNVMRANNLSRHVLAIALSHAELLPPLAQLFSRFAANDLYAVHFDSITAMMKALAHFEERTAANMVEQLHASEVTDSDILDFIFVFSQLGNLPHEKRDAAIKSVAPYFAEHFGKPWPREGSARVKKLFAARTLLHFMITHSIPTDPLMAGWDEFLRAAINDPKGSEPVRHTLTDVKLKPRISDDTGEADDETADPEERRNEPTVDPDLREAAYELMREATRARDKKEFAEAITLAKKGIAALTALDLAEPTHMATMLLAHLYTVRAHETANTPAAVLDLLQALKIYATSLDYDAAKAIINNIAKFDAALAAELESGMALVSAAQENISGKEMKKRRTTLLQLIDEKIAATAKTPSMGPTMTAGKKSGPKATMSARPLLQAERLIVGSKPLIAGPAIREQIAINPLTQNPVKLRQPPLPIAELPDATSDLAPSLVDSSLHPPSSITPFPAARNFAPHAAAVLRFAK